MAFPLVDARQNITLKTGKPRQNITHFKARHAKISHCPNTQARMDSCLACRVPAVVEVSWSLLAMQHEMLEDLRFGMPPLEQRAGRVKVSP